MESSFFEQHEEKNAFDLLLSKFAVIAVSGKRTYWNRNYIQAKKLPLEIWK